MQETFRSDPAELDAVLTTVATGRAAAGARQDGARQESKLVVLIFELISLPG